MTIRKVKKQLKKFIDKKATPLEDMSVVTWVYDFKPTLGKYTLTDLIYVDSNWYAIGSNGTKRLLLQNTASTFDQSNKILDLPDYSSQVIKINT